MKKENLYKLSEYFTKENDSFAENLRYNLDICLKHSDITIHELAESAGISFDTLKNLLYQNSKDCKLSTAALLAKAIGVTVDELIGLDTISEEDMDCITMFRQMPGHYQYFVRWFVRRQYELSLGGFRQGRKTIPVMNLEEHPDSTLHISGDFESIDITDIPQNIKPQIFIGIKTSVDNYMPHYSPYDILLIANDRNPRPTEDSIIIYGNNVFIARRNHCGNGKFEYVSIRDNRFRCFESDIDNVIGYVALVINQ